MPHSTMGYMPLASYPEVVGDEAIEAAVAFAALLAAGLEVTTFSVDIPRVSSGFGDYLVNVAGMVRAAEEKSRAECARLQGLVQKAAAEQTVNVATRHVPLGAMTEAAVAESRYYDLTLLPWSAETGATQDLAQALVFGSGRPSILVPPSPSPASLDHIAIAWDASRVAARALGDALPLLSASGRISVLTVEDEKPLGGTDIAATLAAKLQKRGIDAEPVKVSLGSRRISEALQQAALSQGAGLLAMGGYGHSRIRDFILGGATKGVLARLQLPVLLSH